MICVNALEKAITHIDDLKLLVDLNVHKIVSPDNLDVYMDLCNLIGVIKGDVLESMKEQEPIEPKQQEETRVWTVCGNCSQHLISKWTYCPYCGMKVKWDD